MIIPAGVDKWYTTVVVSGRNNSGNMRQANIEHIKKDKLRLGTHPHLSARLTIRNVAMCDNMDTKYISVDASCRGV